MGIEQGRRQRRAAREQAADAALVAGLDGRAVPGDPGGVPAALVPVRAVQDPVGLDDAHAAGGRPDPGEQVSLRRAPAGDQQEDRAEQRPQARRRDRLPLPGRTRRSTTSSAWSACPATRSSISTRSSRSTASRCRQAQGEFYDDDSMRYAPQFTEKLGEVEHRILVDPKRPPSITAAMTNFVPFRENCRYSRPRAWSARCRRGTIS